MKIKEILEKLTAEGGSNAKMDILRSYKDNALLRSVLYQANSRRVKFYIKRIPEYTHDSDFNIIPLEYAIKRLEILSTREITGHRAIAFLKSLLERCHPDDAYVLERVIEKDLKIGMGATNINKIIPDIIPKTPYMGAKAYSDKLVDNLFKNNAVVISDIKMDGRYCNALIRNGDVELESRQGETTFVGDAFFLKQLAILPNCVLNGELTIKDMDRYEANGVIASIVDIEKKKESRTEKETAKKLENFVKKHGDYQDVLDRIIYTVWDTITIEEYFDKKSKKGYASRVINLYEYVKSIFIFFEGNQRVEMIESKIVLTKEAAAKHFQEALARGLEGTILKSGIGEWKNGKPTWQVKMKLEINLDLKIVGFNYGSKGTKNENVISTLVCESSCGLLNTNPSGMNEEMMDFVTENQDELMGTIVEIRCCGLSTDSDGNWSTLHPSVVKLRDDKDTYDSLKSAQEIENAAKSLS